MRTSPAKLLTLSALCAALFWHPAPALAASATERLAQAQATLQARALEVTRAEAGLQSAQDALASVRAAEAAAEQAVAWAHQERAAQASQGAATMRAEQAPTASDAATSIAPTAAAAPNTSGADLLGERFSLLQHGQESLLDTAEAEEALARAHSAQDAAEKDLQQAEQRLTAAREARDEAQKACDAAQADATAEQEAQRASNQQRAAAEANPDLPPVDWSLGRDEFVAVWGPRIDAWLGSSPLGGHGATFAEAAWDNGVDPRWSPAISNTESSKGAVCFRPCNAWGWGSSSWPDWDTAIRAHVAGLSAGYGHTISQGAARKYCPPNAGHWYSATLACMAQI